MRRLGIACLLLLLLGACVPRSCARHTAPGSGFDCCEGDVLLLLDSSGSVSFYEFSYMLHFLSNLLRPFQVGRGHVRVALVQVHTEPRVEFDFGAHSSQNTLQDALLRTPQLRGDTKTETALLLAQRLLWQPAGQEAPPRVLLWLTDGVEPGNVDGPIAALRKEGVSVLAVSTGHSNYQVFSRAVTPPIEQHLYFVDPDYMHIIIKDLREAITELICTECLHVRDVTSHSAVLYWRPVLTAGLGQYELQYGRMEWSIDAYRKLTLSPDHTWTELTDLQPDTHYSVRLTAHTPHGTRGTTLSAGFTTLPEVSCPAAVMVSESGPDRLRVSWSPVESGRVERYRVEFGPIPRGDVRSVTVSGSQSSVMLTQLQPDTHYLITISAIHSSGQEGAISVKACTQEVLAAVRDLRLTPMGLDSVKVDWTTQEQGAGLQGYWVKWETGEHSPSLSSSSRYLPARSLSTVLTHLNPTTRVCVSPVYRTARGEGQCCTTHTYTAAS
ncbi:von Willebrand factor A domain-containing protein 1 [Ictalurus punctatus]|uniref:von Willebrand factor A domain-containing protein 1 n=1 Tax=Ictalurus punctatus TaxID=7998 RepID=A0A2D0PJA1_ICTPU|nr:von Willebrand factor A domain-containing protein 1 [Ictalurus punctatus]